MLLFRDAWPGKAAFISPKQAWQKHVQKILVMLSCQKVKGKICSSIMIYGTDDRVHRCGQEMHQNGQIGLRQSDDAKA